MPVVLEEEEGEQLEEEEEGLLLLDSSSPSSSPPERRRRQQQPPAIRWDRIVTAGLGVMALTSLLFVATDSSSLLYFTPTGPAMDGGGARRVPMMGEDRPSSFYTTHSYAEKGGKPESASRRPGRPLPPCNYTLLSSVQTGLQWEEHDGDGLLSPVHRACRLRPFEGAEGHAEALRCLKGRHLLFLGDSLSRYQYLSLVHFLEAGTWEEEKEEGARAAAPQGQGGQHYGRSVTYRDGWGEDWNSFYRLTAESLGGHEVCDCVRDGHAPWAENRYYSLPFPAAVPSASRPPQEETGEGGGAAAVRVSFVGWFGVGPRGHALPPGGLANLSQDALGCQPGACRGPHHWKDSPAGFLGGPVLREQLRPDILLLNTGLWKALEAGPELDELVAAAQGLEAEVYYKTTTSRAVGAVWVNDSLPRAAFLQAGLRVFDASLFTTPLRTRPEAYRDGTTHYVPGVYKGLNRLLLNEICPLP